MLLTTEKYSIIGNRSVSELSLEEIVAKSHENVIQSIRSDFAGLLEKYYQLLHSVIEQVFESAMEHSDKAQKADFIQYRLEQSKRIAIVKLGDYLIEKQLQKVLRVVTLGSRVIILRKSLDNSVRPLLTPLIEHLLKTSGCE